MIEKPRDPCEGCNWKSEEEGWCYPPKPCYEDITYQATIRGMRMMAEAIVGWLEMKIDLNRCVDNLIEELRQALAEWKEVEDGN